MSVSEPSPQDFQTIPQDFPLVSLRPVTNAQHGWAALFVDHHPAGNLAALAHYFTEFALQEALCGLPCIVPVAGPQAVTPALAAVFPAASTVLLFPLASCLAADATVELERLQRQGFRLMVQGIPGPGQNLPPAVTALSAAAEASGGWKSPPKSLPGPHLALDVDTPTLFAAAQTAGFSRYAGRYPLNPLPAQQQKGPSRALLLKLLGLVTSDGETHEIEDLLKQTPALSYQLLRLVNSVSFSLNTKISNFGHAIALLGRRQLQRWLQLLLYAQKNGDAQNPLMALAALRASLCEALCKMQGGDREAQERAFMAGMFSLLDALFAMPLAEILAPLNLADEVVAAVLRREGSLGGLLTLAERAETTPDAAFGELLAAAGMNPADYARCLVEACHWTIQVGQGA
ncbi:MAG: HDOD domain-containing protein [Betaproteobacteria bacterium]|nr:HDOD domain-containing protein [Betaproteobacteria bacterium]